ncbi:MAG: hypothetical protein L0I51_05925, partial [Lactococcus plantarum]|nr:hypothetical protein [Lactococcus plantarum]
TYSTIKSQNYQTIYFELFDFFQYKLVSFFNRKPVLIVEIAKKRYNDNNNGEHIYEENTCC